MESRKQKIIVAHIYAVLRIRAELTQSDAPEAGKSRAVCGAERQEKGGKKKNEDELRVHPANTAAKLTGKQDRSTARVGGFNPELVRLRRRSAPVSLVRTPRVLPSLSLSFSLSPSTLVTPSFSGLSTFPSPFVSLLPPMLLYPSLSLLLSRSRLSHFPSSVAIVAPCSLSLFLCFSLYCSRPLCLLLFLAYSHDHRVYQPLTPSLRNLSYCFARTLFPPVAPLSASSRPIETSVTLARESRLFPSRDDCCIERNIDILRFLY